MGNKRNRSRGRGGRPVRRTSRGPRFTQVRLLLGILCLAAAFILVYRSCLAGIFTEDAGLGLWGLIPSVCLLLAGLFSIQMMHRTAPLAFLVPWALCLLADVTSLVHKAKASEWQTWGILAAALGVVYLVLLCLNRRKNLEAPFVFLGITVGLTALFLIFGGKSESAGKEGSQEGEISEDVLSDDTLSDNENTEDGTEESVTGDDASTNAVVPTDGTLYLATDSFIIQYDHHETGEDVNGDSCLYVYYTFTNNSQEELSIPSVSYTKLIQNGEECGKASVSEQNDEMNNYKTPVPAGTKVTACEVYALTDTADVEFQAIEFVPTGGKTASQILEL